MPRIDYIRFVITLQHDFINLLKHKVNPNVSFADEMARLLNISTDSAYRRIRCETDLSLNEAKLLADFYKVSLQNLFVPQQRDFGFVYRAFDRKTLSFERYLTSIVDDLKAIRNASEKSIIYCAKDIPIFHHFQVPELAAFKIFYWMKQVLQLSKYKNTVFSESLIDEKFIEMGQKAKQLYAEVPSIEIWTEETVLSTLKQLLYFHKNQLIFNKALTIKLFDALSVVISQVAEQSKYEYKVLDSSGLKKGASYQLYLCETPITNNTIFVNTDNSFSTYITHNTLNVLMTSNPEFCRETQFYTLNLINNSVLVNEKHTTEHHNFFKLILNTINLYKNQIQ